MADTSRTGLTGRALLTGAILGALLAPANIYMGLRIGFSFNMSIAAALLSYALWNTLHHFGKARHWGLYENNINQTAASAAASILSAGLVAPIPAYTLITGEKLSFGLLVPWVFVVSFLGILTALAVRRQMIEREKLPFPNGLATAETIQEIYATGKEAAIRIRYLLGAGLVSGLLGLYVSATANNGLLQRLGLPGIPSLQPPEKWGFSAPGAGLDHVSWRDMGIQLTPSLLLVGFGAIVGPRVGVSLLIGTILAWIALPPILLERGWAFPVGEGISWYETMLDWLLWPGVALMVAASLTSALLFLGRGLLRATRQAPSDEPDDTSPAHRRISPTWFWGGTAFALVTSVLAQKLLFGIPLWLGVVAFGLSFLLAIVAARVSGETGIAPIGALGKVTQVSFGFLAPGSQTINLMAANVTGGAAGQCSDLLHDLKTGRMIGADLTAQIAAQVTGIVAGSFAGTLAYLILIPDPQEMLLTPEWPAPAVATWKAVAEVVAEGLNTIPPSSLTALVWAGLIGILLACLEFFLPSRFRPLVPSASSVGFAFIIPPFISLAIFLGSILGVVVGWINVHWKKKYLIVLAAGLVAGESLAGVLDAFLRFFS